MTAFVFLPILVAIVLLLVGAYLLAEIDYETRRDVRELQRREAARRRLSSPRSLP